MDRSRCMQLCVLGHSSGNILDYMLQLLQAIEFQLLILLKRRSNQYWPMKWSLINSGSCDVDIFLKTQKRREKAFKLTVECRP